jgi:predicted metal-dependent hydrolase
MGKHQKIAAKISGRDTAGRWHPCYLEYFRLFNAQEYYAAHDILEHIWLGADGALHTYYKALIQFAGGFVHLQHHHREPAHRIHGRRLRPATRLFLRSVELLESFPVRHEGISLAEIRQTARTTAATLIETNFTENPWSPDQAPQLNLPTP